MMKNTTTNIPTMSIKYTASSDRLSAHVNCFLAVGFSVTVFVGVVVVTGDGVGDDGAAVGDVGAAVGGVGAAVGGGVVGAVVGLLIGHAATVSACWGVSWKLRVLLSPRTLTSNGPLPDETAAFAEQRGDEAVKTVTSLPRSGAGTF